MAIYTDKKLKLGELLDTNINVFALGSLPLNGTYGFGGVKTFTKKAVTSSSTFTKKKFTAATNFSDKKA